MASISVFLDGEEHSVELADSLLEKSWGLSMRTSGKMLFRFSREWRPAIDMMLVQKPLKLYFLDPDGEVVEVQDAEPWTLDPRTWRIYRPETAVKYLLESFEDLGLEEGDQVEFDL